MVTLYDLGISLSFITKNTRCNVINVAEGIDEIDSPYLSTVSFEEYQNVRLEFYSDSDGDRIYFDGIDLLPADLCEIDERGKMYLKPLKGEGSYPIFEHTSQYYAMRVGRFEVRIYHNNQIYYQWFSVVPKNVDMNEWKIMQQELEAEIQGLSSDIIRKNISLGTQEYETVPSQELYKFFVIKRHANSILAALIDLKDKPNYKVEKKYNLESLHHATYIDNVTVKDYLKKGTGEEKYLVPKRIYNYDLPENRWLKRIIEIYENELRQFLSATTKYIQYIKKELKELSRNTHANIATIQAKRKAIEELERYLATASTILSISELIKEQEWYKQIRKVDSIMIPHVLVYDVRYSAFYKMYQELQRDNMCVEWSEDYSYSWKLSSKMYEIWSFIKLCRFLISDVIGFEAKGWVFDEYKKERVLVPELVAGTVVEFYKGNFMIKLHYDEILPNNIKQAVPDNKPLISKSRHIRPDIRMDLYKDNLYWSSLIFEVKYRVIDNFWGYGESSCKEQIRAYKNDTISPFCRGLDSDFVLRKIRPVDRVWVFNPTHTGQGVVDKRDEGIKFVQLIPGYDAGNVIDELLDEINVAYDGEFKVSVK